MVIYLSLINVTGFFLMGVDKNRAKRGAWRISEKTLFGCALLGGSLGTTIGMHVFHHKTKHWYFKYGMPLILMIQVLFMCYITN
ncbi:MAG: DUF1294 domain-containing protein [Lachnospiraceae bacterium]|nr:DUF1294 domain-containing protein [Lachnospiraceae bacterium]